MRKEIFEESSLKVEWNELLSLRPCMHALPLLECGGHFRFVFFFRLVSEKSSSTSSSRMSQ